VYIGFGMGYAYLEEERRVNVYLVRDWDLDRTSSIEICGARRNEHESNSAVIVDLQAV